MNLTTLKAQAELAKTSQQDRDEWGEDIDPDDVLRLVEVARLALQVDSCETPGSYAMAFVHLHQAVRGIEP